MVRADLLTDAAALLRPEWLSTRRWFGARDRTIGSVSVADAARLPRGALRGATLLVAQVVFDDGDRRRYLLPLVSSSDGLREPADGEGAWQALAAAIVAGATLPGEAGSFRCEPLPASAELVPGGTESVAGMEERRLTVEQSNTSVTLGDRLILKLYRRLEPGENPEIEIGTFLESVGCAVAPRLAGVMRYLPGDGSSPAAAAMLQERVAARGDAWAFVGGQLAGEDGGPEAALEATATIGEVTAELHASLAARPLDVAFPVRAATTEELVAWRSGALAQLDGAIAALGGEERDRLETGADRIRRRLEAAFDGAAAPRVCRTHGDYHLGQLLRTADRFVVIDFEGEPARPLEERRAPQPPERDLAGMLRSFDYAARTAERGNHAMGFDASTWLARARPIFLAGYARVAPSAPDPALLEAFELEKACYEVRYEAANRPDWTWLPLAALAPPA